MNKDKQKDIAKSNPFVYQGPVPPNLFVGREREIDIIRRLANPISRGSSAVSGEHGTGKTSLLDYISTPAVYEEWGLSRQQCAFIKINCSTITPFTQTAFWREVLRLIEYEIQNNNRLKRQIEELHTKKQIRGFDMAELFDQIAEAGKLIVLLLDEFDWVVKNVDPQEPHFLNVMRSIINRSQGLAVITATLEPLDALCRNVHFAASPFHNIFAFVQLKPFTRDEADELIDRLLVGTGVRFTENDRRSVYKASNKGHPARLQKACYDLFEKYAKRSMDKGAKGS